MARRTKAQAEAWRLKCVAYHEAGHAVAAYWLGCELERATIEPDYSEHSGGHVLLRGLPAEFCPSPDSDDETRAIAEKRMMVFLAGGFCEARFRGRRNLFGAGGDRREVYYFAEGFCREAAGAVSGPELRAWVRLLSIRVENLFGRMEGAPWFAVKALAEALLARRTIEGTEARKIIRDAMKAATAADTTGKRHVRRPKDEG